MDCNEIKVPAEFSDICPFSDEVFHNEMAKLVEEPGFKHAVTYAMPNISSSLTYIELIEHFPIFCFVTFFPIL